MIQFKNVTKKYDIGEPVLDNLNLKIDSGEFVFIMGGSGAGKTTLTKLLLREEKATSGEIFVDDTDISRLPTSKIPKYRRRIGVVFQDFRLFRNKTVFENVAFALRVVENPPQKELRARVMSMLKIVGLDDKAEMFPPQLSGGEQQRVALARAVINNPHTIIADEPTGNLDPELSVEIMSLLLKMNSFGKTVVVVTHERDLVEMFKQRVIVLKDGKIAQDIPAERREMGGEA